MIATEGITAAFEAIGRQHIADLLEIDRLRAENTQLRETLAQRDELDSLRVSNGVPPRPPSWPAEKPWLPPMSGVAQRTTA